MKQPIRSIPIFAFLWLSTVLPAQNPLKDALTLQRFFVEDGTGRAILSEKKAITTIDSTEENILHGDVAAVLARYMGCDVNEITTNKIDNTFGNGNPYLRISLTSMDRIGGVELEGLRSQSAAGGFSVGNLVDGLARFLVQRTKDELTLAFFEDFKKEMQKEPILKNFFPTTRDVLLSIDTDIYNFRIYLEALRESYIYDMRRLPGSLETYLRESPVSLISASDQAIAIDFFHLAQMAVDGKPAPDMVRYGIDQSSAIQQRFKAINTSLNGLDWNKLTAEELKAKGLTEKDLKMKDLSAGLQLVGLLSESLFNPETGKWFDGSDINSALKDPMTLRIYLGLLWHQSHTLGIQFKDGTSLDFMIGKAATTTLLFKDWQTVLTAFGKNADELQETLQTRDNNAQLPYNFSQYTQLFTQVLQSVNTLGQLILNRETDIIDNKYLVLVQQVSSLHFNVRQKHYSAAVGNTVFTLEILLGKSFPGKDKVLRYGSFLAAIAEAESPEEVQQALESFALPPGSARAKKGAGKRSIAINAYTGLSGGVEQFRESSESKGVTSVAAPIGFSINWGNTWGKKNRPGAVGIFVPIIDIGAVLAYRFKDDGVESLPPLEWKNIIAPGAYFVVNPPLGKFPLAIGLGGQLGPSLRRVNKAGTFEKTDVGAYRIGGFITVDIPVNYLRLKGGE